MLNNSLKRELSGKKMKMFVQISLIFLVLPALMLTETLCPPTSKGETTDTNIEYDRECDPTDCSQKARFKGDSLFECAIGRQAECYDVNQEVQSDWLDESNSNYAKLAHVNVYPRQYSHSKHLAFNYSFLTPHSDSGALEAKMVVSRFESSLDSYYRDHPLYRLFNFRNTSLTENDLDHPREIIFPCTVGILGITKPMYYQLKLTVLPYQAFLVYHILVHSDESLPDDEFTTTAIAEIKQKNKIHVVFEKYSPKYQVLYHNLTLYRNNNHIQTVKVSDTTFQYEFDIKENGEYSVGVVGVNKRGKLKESLSKSVIVIPKKNNYSNHEEMLKIAAVVAAILLAFIISIFGIRVIHRRKKRNHSTERYELNNMNMNNRSIEEEPGPTDTYSYKKIQDWDK